MPEATVKSTGGKIALGFGLEGYTITQPQNDVNPTAFGVSIGGAGGFGGGVELDGHFMKDAELKQDYIDLEHYLSFPIEYKDSGGNTAYAMYKDASSNTDTAHTVGTLAHGGACCPLLGASPPGSANSPSSGIGQRILAAESSLKEYNGGSTTDFLVGAAVSSKTILEYFSHFYPNAGVTEQHINKLCQKGLLNAEVLFNFGGGKGKAFRLKIVDTYKTENKFCVMSVFFMTSALKSYCPLTGSHLDKTFSNARNDGYKFPLEDKRYDYKTGTIAGYNPNFIRSIADYIKFDFSGTGNLTQFGVNQESAVPAKCRVRYFIDEGKKGEAGTVCTTLPDELFKTNYADGSDQTFETGGGGDFDASKYDSAGAAIAAAADEISKFINCIEPYNTSYNLTQRSHFRYHALTNGATPTTKTTEWPFNWMPNSSPATKFQICCGSFVFWALGESGVTVKGYISNSDGQMKLCTANTIQKVLAPGYKAVDIGTDPSKGQKGDVVIYGKNGATHGGIFDSYDGIKIKEWGAGGGKGIPGDSKAFSNTGKVRDTNRTGHGVGNLSHIIRIVKETSDLTSS